MGFNAAPNIRLDNAALNYAWSHPIPAYETQFGMLLFDTRVECDIHEGSLVQFKLDLTDSLGKTSSNTSPEISVRKKLNFGNSIQQQSRPNIEFDGFVFNVTDAYRMLRGDPPPLQNLKRVLRYDFPGDMWGLSSWKMALLFVQAVASRRVLHLRREFFIF